MFDFLSQEPVRVVLALLLTFGFLIGSMLILLYLERKIAAFIQDRHGPHHVGKWGLLQAVADTFKLLLKEDVISANVDRRVFIMAPVVFFSPVIAAFAVLPFSKDLTAINLNVGVIYLMALGSLDVLGLIMAGWSSNNKYSLIGGFRAAAQMISYELPLGLSFVVPVMLAGSLSLVDIVHAQDHYWFVLIQPLALVTMFTAGLAETNRNPFDLPEAESELVAGFMTEYSGLRWAMFFLGEYGNMIVVSSVAATMFFGGWHGWLLPGILWFLAKVYIFLCLFMWIRSTLPRLRADQLMSFGWKVLIPLTLVNLVVTSFVILLLPDAYQLPLGIISWALMLAFVFSFRRVVFPRRVSKSLEFRRTA